MSSVAVLIPTRDRPDLFDRAVRSVMDTSKADVYVYCDDDQPALYAAVWNSITQDHPTRCFATTGLRIGPVASANLLARRAIDGGANAVGLITDDSYMTTPHWDDWLMHAISECPNRIGVISPYHNHGNHVDMPFVSREWMQATGWYAYPECWHWAWPIITGLIGEMSGIIHAPKGSFALHHDYEHHMNLEKGKADAEAFFEFVALKLPAVVERVRNAMAG